MKQIKNRNNKGRPTISEVDRKSYFSGECYRSLRWSRLVLR
ncbi:MAG: hypothetical protein SNH27_10475 [Rikenellaceae bacterium]